MIGLFYILTLSKWVYQNSQNCSSKSISLYANCTLILRNVPPKLQLHFSIWGFPGGAVVKNLPGNAGDARDVGSIPGLRSSPGEGTGNLLQYSGLGNPTDTRAWWATVQGVMKIRTQLSTSLYTKESQFCVNTHKHVKTCR